MTFLYPYVLFALAAPVLLALLALVQHRSAGQSWRQLVSPAHPELVHRRPRWQVGLPTLLALLALTGIILAGARPINGYEQGEGSASGRNLMIALDISRSMETQDVSPSRLEEARAAAYELIDALPGDKIGLIVFSGEADVVVPLTYDHTALRDALEQVNRSWAGIGGTNFGLLLRKAMQNFAHSAPDGANALVILSDGEDTVDSSLQIAEEAKKEQLLVITVGIGTPAGGPIPDRQGENGLWQDSGGRHVISKLDMAALRRFSEATGGSFFAMSSGADLSAFAREAVEKLERHEESFATGRTPNDLFSWFALPSLLALLAAIALGTEWRAPRHTAAAALLALLCAGYTAPALPAPQAYEQGVLALKDDKVDTARESFSEALLSKDTQLQAAAHLALGNIQTRATFQQLRQLYTPSDEGAAAQPDIKALQGIVDKLKENLTPYRDALAAAPTLAAAQENVDKVQELIKKLEEEIERLKQQQDQQNQQNDQQQQDDQDKQDDQQQQDDQDKQDDQQQGDQDKQDDQQQQGDQDKQDDQQQGDQDKPDDQQQGDQDKQDDQQQGDQDKQDDQQQQGDQDQQDDQQQQGDQDQQDDQQQDDQPQDARQGGGDRQQQAAMPQESELSDEEKAKQRAASILRMHLEEEKGSPIPHDTRATRPPAKDY